MTIYDNKGMVPIFKLVSLLLVQPMWKNEIYGVPILKLVSLLSALSNIDGTFLLILPFRLSRADETPRMVLGKTFYPPKERRWALSQERIEKFAKVVLQKLQKLQKSPATYNTS